MPAHSPGRSSCVTSQTAERNWQGWLFRVAQREAWRLDEVAKRTIPYDPPEEPVKGVLIKSRDVV